MKNRVAVGLSGGVDSSVAAALLMDQDYEVSGIYITCWDGPGCKSEEERQDALDVGLQLGIPFIHLDFQKEYKEKVYEYMMAEYEAGRTPNPDVMCNKEIKFGLFYDWAIKQGYQYVATGHYAQTDGKQLLRSVDEHKDQTYFLYQLNQKQFNQILFPIGHLTKTEVRAEAKKRELLTANKPDSQGICFVGEVSVSKFLEERIEKKPGEIQFRGRAVGNHKGVWFYTIGQKIRIDQTKKLQELGFDMTKLPHFYVVNKDVMNNVIEVGMKDELYANEVILKQLHWIGEKPNINKLLIRIRHGGELIPGELEMMESKLKSYKLKLEKPVWGAAPGQSVVIYQEKKCLGGGIIRGDEDGENK